MTEKWRGSLGLGAASLWSSVGATAKRPPADRSLRRYPSLETEGVRKGMEVSGRSQGQTIIRLRLEQRVESSQFKDKVQKDSRTLGR